MTALTTPLPRKLVPNQHPGDERAQHGVDRGDRERGTEAELQRGQRLRARDTTSQNPSVADFVDSQTSAAIGNVTTTVRNIVTKPSERAVPALSPLRRPGRARSVMSTLDT